MQVGGAVVLLGDQSGQTIIPQPTPLTRLNYFDGKFLRADDLQLEQRYLRELTALSNQGGGPGVVYGFNTQLGGGDQLLLGAGLAIDPHGRVLLLPQAISVGLGALIDASRQRPEPPGPRLIEPPILRPPVSLRLVGSMIAAAAPAAAAPVVTPTPPATFTDCVAAAETPPGEISRGTDLYLITIGHAEALCGEEDVYGRLCEEACITVTARPYRVEGVVVRVVPLVQRTPLATSGAVALDRRHLRSLVASAYFADERNRIGALISRAGLALDTWCLGALPVGGTDVALAVVARAGSTTVFLDAWTARRERMEAPPRRHWAWRMAMRPWDVYLAQILQFQCQLHEVLTRAPEPGAADDPCRPQQTVLGEAAKYLTEIETHYREFIGAPAAGAGAPSGGAIFTLPGGAARLADVRTRMISTLQLFRGGVRTRVLIQGGIVELPSAGYLPVVPGTAVTVNEQVRALLGEGLDLRFCVVRPDFVAHALEEAQHMERISLLHGLDHTDDRPDVDVLVPDGEIVTPVVPPPGIGFEAALRVTGSLAGLVFTPAAAGVTTHGLAAAAPVPAPLPTPIPAPQPGIPLHGVARGERVGVGGAAFYLAGMVVEDLKTVDPTRATLSVVPDIPMLHMATPATAALFDAAATATVARTTAGAADEPVLLQAARGQWMMLRTEADPFALSPSDTTQMSGELTFAQASGVHQEAHLTRAQWLGTFRVTQHTKTLLGRGVSGFFSGVRIESTIAGAVAGEDSQVLVNYAVKLFHPASTDGDEFTVEFTESGPQTPRSFRVLTAWSGDPLAVNARLQGIGPTSAGGTSAVDLLITHLTESAAAMQFGSQSRREATQAIDLIASLMNAAGKEGTALADRASRLLFPPPPPPTTELTVRATRDWVLFHRRRDKMCVRAVERPVLPPRRYQLYHYKLDDPAKLDALRKLLQTQAGPDPAVYPYQAVDVLEYAGGLATLLSDSRAILADWRAKSPGNRLLYGAAATPAAVDPAWLASERVTRAVEVISAVTPLDAAYDAEVLPQVPARQAVQGTDGIVFLVTYDVATTCHALYRFLSTDAMGDHPNAILSPQVPRVGIVEFTGDSRDVPTATQRQLISAWEALFADDPGTAVEVVVFAKKDDPATADKVRLLQRANAVLTTVGAPSAGEVKVIETDWPTAVSCPVIIVVRVQPTVTTTCHAVYRLAVENPTSDVWDTVLLDRVLAQAGARRLGAVRFLDNLSQPDAGDMTSVGQAWSGGPPVKAVVYGKVGDAATSDAVLVKARAQSIVDPIAQGAGGPPPAVKVGPSTQTWPQGEACPAITVLLVGPQAPPVVGTKARVVVRRAAGPGDPAGVPVRLSLTDDVIEFSGTQVNQQDPNLAKVIGELRQLLTQSGSRFVDLVLAIGGTPDPSNDQARLTSVWQLLTTGQPPVIGPNDLGVLPHVDVIAAGDRGILGEDNVVVNDLAHLFMERIIG